MPVPILEHFRALVSAAGRRLVGLCERESHVHTQRCFSAAINGWIVLHTLLLLPYYESIWGPESLVNRPVFDAGRWEHWCFHLLHHPQLGDHTWLFLAGQLVCAALVLARLAPRLGALGVYFFTLNIYNRTGPILDGGNNLVQLLMLYLVLVNTSGTASQLRSSVLRRITVACSNVAFYMCRIQIVIVYFCAGVLKLTGPLWQKGMALYYILQSEGYTNPSVRELVLTVPEAAMLATYATVAFQILFVVLIWWRPARPYLIAAGVSLHLGGIAYGMGLLLFGLVMCAAYTAFLPDSLSARLRGPWVASTPLAVSCPETQPRLRGILSALARLDWRGNIRITTEAAEELSATDLGSGETSRGLRALWTACRRVPVLLPLLPLLALVWYVGIGQLVYHRVLRVEAAAPRGDAARRHGARARQGQ